MPSNKPEYMKAYYLRHKTGLLAKGLAETECPECKVMVKHSYKTFHSKTRKHLNAKLKAELDRMEPEQKADYITKKILQALGNGV